MPRQQGITSAFAFFCSLTAAAQKQGCLHQCLCDSHSKFRLVLELLAIQVKMPKFRGHYIQEPKLGEKLF